VSRGRNGPKQKPPLSGAEDAKASEGVYFPKVSTFEQPRDCVCALIAIGASKRGSFVGVSPSVEAQERKCAIRIFKLHPAR
jgi:hypothetical protein